MKRFEVEPSAELTDAERELVETLLNYPSLEKIFDSGAPHNQAKIRQNMQARISELERVVRRGSRAEAEKAARVVEAIQTTLRFLDELDG